ncbi:MAG: SGNH/GDSL hydrolase family protein [Bacteroidales bacterium]|nr:SGNH/GDSL hydrolase family protein [Bacteroidales bacterium]
MKNIRISGYDFTLLEFEGNDCDFNWSAIAADPGLRHLPNMPVTEFSMKYGRIVDRVREHGASPVILTLPPVDPEKYFAHITRGFSEEGRRNVLDWLGGTPDFIREWHEMYNCRVLEMASRKGVPVIDVTSPFYSRPDYGKLLCEDGAHPNAQGQAVMAGALEDGLRKIIEERSLEGLGGVQVAFC